MVKFDASRPAGGQLDAVAWLAAVVDNSDDAIVSKTLDGIITSWNAGATHLFGFAADEAVGRPVTLIIPDERLHEEEAILARLRRGDRVDHFETVRRKKGGELVDVSLTVSPVLGEGREILGASKIARDITHQKRAQETQELLAQEMRHRVKNLFALTKGLIAISAREATTVEELAHDLAGRLMALASAHELTLPDANDEDAKSTSLQALLRAILRPYEDQTHSERVTIRGDDVCLAAAALTPTALILHEIATNAAKHGGLSSFGGTLDIVTCCDENGARLTWTEAGVLTKTPEHQGFGSRLEAASLRGTGGEIIRDYRADGLTLTLTIPRDQVCPTATEQV